MPEFKPSSVHTATAGFLNPKSAGFDYQAQLCMGVDWVEMARASFHLGGSQEKGIPFQVTMPDTPGEYPVYVRVSSGGVLVATFAATEKVIILSPIPVEVYICVYCLDTFSTEADLISHTQSRHPGKPYLVYAYPAEAQVAGGEAVKINYKVYTPAVPPGDRTYGFTFYIPDFKVWEPYNGAFIDLRGETPEGFYEGAASMYAGYITGGWPYKFADMPPGTYKLYSKCRHLADVGEYRWATKEIFWEDVDTRQTITVV